MIKKSGLIMAILLIVLGIFTVIVRANHVVAKGNMEKENNTILDDKPEGFVEITEKVRDDKDNADISDMDKEVYLADNNASGEALSLYSYMKAISNSGKVIFGQQNGNDEHVSKRDNVTSDVKDITGSFPAIVGIDTLAIAGDSKINRGSNTKETLEYAVERGKEAIADGAIITLSMHAPNMGAESIEKDADGKYNFWKCSFADSQNTGGDCAAKCLPGGEYNDRYNAYLDIAADYIEGLGDVPILFRPLHESSGNWFWWGSGNTDKETYKALFRYTKDYMSEVRNLHNLIYVFSPGGTSDEDEYLQTYPGDEYVDILGFDSYDSADIPYNSSFLDQNLREYCKTVASLAKKKDKIAAISETGCLLKARDCAIKNQDWYRKVFSIAKETGMAYGLLWSNYDESNFYVPFKYDDTKGHEVINDFIKLYNEEYTVFARDLGFYDGVQKYNVKNTNKGKESGYFTDLRTKSAIINARKINSICHNVDQVNLVLKNLEDNKNVTIDMEKSGNMYEAEVTDAVLGDLGETSRGTAELAADGKILQTIKGLSFNKEVERLPKNTLEDFELYIDDEELKTVYSHNGSGGYSELSLCEKFKNNGSYSGAFTYSLSGESSYTGRFKSLENAEFDSDVNALAFWMKPDGHGEEGAKVILQIGTSLGGAEVNLVKFAAQTEGKYIVIPLEVFSKSIATDDISTLAFYRNNPEQNAPDIVDSTIYFDDIEFIKTDINKLELNEDGYAILDEPLDICK